MRRILLSHRHGLGDCVQFTAVIKHLMHHHPDWAIDVAALKGKHSCFFGLATHVINLDTEQPDRNRYDQVFEPSWDECWDAYSGYPSTKTCKCLREVFHLEPKPELLAYEIRVRDEARQRVLDYLAQLPESKGFVAIHYQGNTAQKAKDLPHEVIGRLCGKLLDNGYTPLILDWDRRSPIPDGKTILCPDGNNPLWLGYGTGDAETLCALLQRAALTVAIDSGPQKVAVAAGCPLLAVWTGHHPIHYLDHSPPKCRNLVPVCHGDMVL